MKFFKKRYFLVFIAVAVIGGAAALAYGFLPVAKIDGKYVSYAFFLKSYRGVEAAERLKKTNPPATTRELMRRAFETIVENNLLEIMIVKTNAGLLDEAKANVERAIAESKELSLEEAARKLYGLSAADFKQLVLIPAAEKDLLTKHYEYNPAELTALWEEVSGGADIRIYYPGYGWSDGEVKIK